jgi:hypothetical protein
VSKQPKAELSNTTTSPEGSSQKPAAAQKATATEAKSPDVVLIHGLTDDKRGLKVLRARNDTVESGEVRPLAHGQPITSDVVRLKPREGAPHICDVETELSMAELRSAAGDGGEVSSRSASNHRPGPARVANRAYRENWDTIWARNGSPPTTDPSKLN